MLALFGSPAELADPTLAAAVHAIEQEVFGDEDALVMHPWSIQELAGVDGLTDTAYRDLARVASSTAAEVVGRLATVSAYLLLSVEARAQVLRRIHGVLPDRVGIDATVQLFLARRR